MRSFDLRASTEDIEEAEGMTGEFVLREDHERVLATHKALTKKVIMDLGASMQAAAERMKELESVRERYQAEEDVLTAAEAWLASWPELDDLAEAGKLGRGEARLYRAVKALRKGMK